MSPAPSQPFRFALEGRSGAARAGAFSTPHGPFSTPAFMPVGTHGAVKAMTPEQVAATGSQIVLANTYHLHLRPGIAQPLDGRQGNAQARIVGNPAVLHRDIEVYANEGDLAGEVGGVIKGAKRAHGRRV